MPMLFSSTATCGQLGGAKAAFILEDTQAKPDTAVTKANKLILQDKVHMLVGGLLASTAYALAPVSTREKMLYVGSIATADESRLRTFMWFVTAVAGLTVRVELLGVTSIVRALNLLPRCSITFTAAASSSSGFRPCGRKSCCSCSQASCGSTTGWSWSGTASKPLNAARKCQP